MEYEDLTKQVIGCAYRVYNRMGFGFLESVYEKCMVVELSRAGIQFEEQKHIEVTYDGQQVGDFVADLIVEDKLIVELKSVRALNKAHEVQLVNYLVATNKPIGLLINFAENEVQVKRKVKDLKPRQTQSGCPWPKTSAIPQQIIQ